MTEEQQHPIQRVQGEQEESPDIQPDESSGVTGETHHVDCGYNIVGMKAVDAPDISVAKSDEAA